MKARGRGYVRAGMECKARSWPAGERRHSRETWSRRSFLERGTKIGLGALIAPAFGACQSDPVRVGGTGDPRLTVQPFAPTMSAAAGATPLGLGGSRDGVLYVPSTYDPATPGPLVVAMHGTPGSSSLWVPFYQACEAQGMVMLAVDSRGLGWDLIDIGEFGPDPDFIDQALTFTFERCLIDTTRIVLLGFSDGASYTLSLGTSNGDLFTHLVSFSPGFWTSADPLIGRPEIFVSHGTEDQILPITASRVEIVPVLRAFGYDVTYEEFVGPHTVPADIARMAFDWFGAPELP